MLKRKRLEFEHDIIYEEADEYESPIYEQAKGIHYLERMRFEIE
jgi:hypothetical protein